MYKTRKPLEMSPEVKAVLEEVWTDYDSTGCEECGVVSQSTANKVRAALGEDLLDADYEDEKEEDEEDG